MAGLPKDIPYTQVPNSILDVKLKDLKSSELKILMLICRKTFGYQKRKDSISLSQMTKYTGLTKSTVIEAVRGLEKKDIIQKHTDKRTHQYSIEIEPLTTSSGPKNEPTKVQNSDPWMVQKSDTQKKASKQKEKNTTTDSSSYLSEDVLLVVQYWNNLFDIKIVSVYGKMIPLIEKALKDFTKEQLFQAMKNRSTANYYKERYGLKHTPTCFFEYPQTIKNDLNRIQKDLYTYKQVVDRITAGKNVGTDFEIVSDQLDKQGNPMRRLIG